MSLKKAASLGALQSAVQMAASFLSVKITSVYLGPVGLGLLGQLQNFISMSQGVLVSGLSTGMVRRTAEYGPDGAARARLVSTVMRLVLVVGVPVAVLLALGSGWLAERLLHDASLRTPLLVFASVYVFGLLGGLIVGSANGARDYKTITVIQIGAGLMALALFALLCPVLGVAGGLLAAAVAPASTAAIAWLTARRRPWWPRRPLSHGFSGSEARAAVAFIPMAATAAIAMPLIQILIRDTLARHAGMASVGLLQGVTRLSDLYLGVVTTIYGMYFLPRFAEIRRADELKRELLKGMMTIVPAVCAASFAIYLLRDLIVHLVFTKEFLPMRELFGWQMTGNVMRATSWLFGYLLVAKANPLAMAVFEVLTGVFWWRAGVVLVEMHGAVGASQAYALSCTVYLVIAVAALAWMLRRMRQQEIQGGH